MTHENFENAGYALMTEEDHEQKNTSVKNMPQSDSGLTFTFTAQFVHLCERFLGTKIGLFGI